MPLEPATQHTEGTVTIHCPACGQPLRLGVLVAGVSRDETLMGAPALRVELQPLTVRHECRVAAI